MFSPSVYPMMFSKFFHRFIYHSLSSSFSSANIKKMEEIWSPSQEPSNLPVYTMFWGIIKDPEDSRQDESMFDQMEPRNCMPFLSLIRKVSYAAFKINATVFYFLSYLFSIENYKEGTWRIYGDLQKYDFNRAFWKT